MLYKDNFSTNLKLLRTSHYLSMNELAIWLEFKNKGTIGQMETGKTLPSYEKLLAIADIFAVSIDWLVGRIDEPYNEELIISLENSLEDTKINYDNIFKNNVPPFYADHKLRKENYSLAHRANIIFMLQYLRMLVKQNPAVLIGSPPYLSQPKSFIDNIPFFGPKRLKNTNERYLYVLRCTYALTSLNAVSPLFNLYEAIDKAHAEQE